MRRVLTISMGAVTRVLSMPAAVLELYKEQTTVTSAGSDNGKQFLISK